MYNFVNNVAFTITKKYLYFICYWTRIGLIILVCYVVFKHATNNDHYDNILYGNLTGLRYP